MRSLRSLIDWLPYYFKASDTYIKDGKGLFERYLEIFGNYFEDKVVGDIDSLDGVIDVDNTPEVYLGYLWEFLGAMPYANPHAIDPERWKILFNGFDSPSTIETLKKYWLYPMNTSTNSSNDHFDLTDAQVRSLVKYSIALFSIRGTRRFFEVLLKLYGLDVTIGQYSPHPSVTVEDDDSDYYGSDQDYYGTDDDYAGSVDSLFDSLTENTKIDTEFSELDGNCQLDNHSSCSRCVTVIFTLKTSDDYTYIAGSNQFQRLYKRMYNLINTFLPLGARPHLVFKDINVDGVIGVFDPKTIRSIEAYIDRLPEVYTGNLPLVDNGDGWYKFSGSQVAFPLFYDGPVRLKIKVVDSGILDGSYGEPTPKTFQIRFNGDDWSDDFEDGHIFTLLPRNYVNDYGISVRPTSISPLEYTLVTWNCPMPIWFTRVYQYEIFNEQSVGPYKLTATGLPYVVVAIQSYAGRTRTKNEDPSDDSFIGLPVLNFTTGNYLYDADDGSIEIVIAGTTYTIDTTIYQGKHCYLEVLTEPGIYEFRQEGRPENFIKVELTIDYNVGGVTSRPTLEVVSGSTNYVVTEDNPTTGLLRFATMDYHYLLDLGAERAKTRTLVCDVDASDDNLKSLIDHLINPITSQSRDIESVHNYCDIESVINGQDLLDLINYSDSNMWVSFLLSYLTNPIHTNYQAIIITLSKVESTVLKKNIYTVLLNQGRVSPKSSSIGINGESYTSEVLNINDFTVYDSVDNSYLTSTGVRTLDKYPISTRSVKVKLKTLLNRFFNLSHPSEIDRSLTIGVRTLYRPNSIIVDVNNPNRRYNSGEGFYLDDPGLYVFRGFNPTTGLYSTNQRMIDIISKKYKDNYIIEIIDDGNKSDDTEYMLRMGVPEDINGSDPGTILEYTFKVRLTLNIGIVDAQDILIIDPNAFDFNVLVYRGTTPNNGTYLGEIDISDFQPVTTDDDGNILPNYTVEAEVTWKYVKGDYTVGNVTVGEGQSAQTIANRPPGVYCFRLHDVEKALPGTPTYRCIDIYEQSIKGENNLFFDVDVLSRAWVKPAAQVYDYDNQGNKTWGFYKTHPDFAYAVRSCRYDPAITETMPQFRLNLDNNPMGYKRVMMYKLIDNASGGSWDEGSQYTPINYTAYDPSGATRGHWLNEAAGGVDDSWKATGDQKWVFTGTVYNLGELITGPQQPGKYIFRVEQINTGTSAQPVYIDKPINYAYLEVKEDIKYALIVDPDIEILQGSAVMTNVSAVSSAKFTKEDLVVTVVGPDGQQYSEEYTPPFSFYAYQVGEYIFTLNRRESDNTLTPLVTAVFKVLNDSGVSKEYLPWNWDDVAEKEVNVVTTSNDIEWTVEILDD